MIPRRKDSSNKKASFLMASDRVVKLARDDDPLKNTSEYLAIAELGGSKRGDRNDVIYLAAELSKKAVDNYLSNMLTTRRVAFWATASKAVGGREQKRLGALVLSEESVPLTDEEALPALLKGFKEMGGIANMGLSKELEAWRNRVIWLRRQEMADSGSDLPDLNDSALNATAHVWLAPHLGGKR
eukprot:gene8968-16103_t